MMDRRRTTHVPARGKTRKKPGSIFHRPPPHRPLLAGAEPFRDIDQEPILNPLQGRWKLFTEKAPEAVPTQHETKTQGLAAGASCRETEAQTMVLFFTDFCFVAYLSPNSVPTLRTQALTFGGGEVRCMVDFLGEHLKGHL